MIRYFSGTGQKRVEGVKLAGPSRGWSLGLCWGCPAPLRLIRRSWRLKGAGFRAKHRRAGGRTGQKMPLNFGAERWQRSVRVRWFANERIPTFNSCPAKPRRREIPILLIHDPDRGFSEGEMAHSDDDSDCILACSCVLGSCSVFSLFFFFLFHADDMIKKQIF